MALHAQLHNKGLYKFTKLLLSGNKFSFARICSYYHQQQILKREPTEEYDNQLPPVQALQDRINRGELTQDDNQMKVMEALERVYHEVQSYSPPTPSVFDKLFKVDRKVSTPKGVYLHGSVGGGKTMLMDIFYNCCMVSV